jgi:phosphatidylserine/phosphatidylglycerophosphate/cardiolipin synthase-like enzyme
MRILSSLAIVATLVTGCVGAAPDDIEDEDAIADDGDTLLIEADVGPAPVGTQVTLGGYPAWVHFTNPAATNGDDRNILKEAVRLIKATPAGKTIRIAVHSLTVNKVEQAILEAKGNGVIIKVAEDGSDEFDADSSPRRVAAALGADHVFCGSRTKDGNHGCIPTNPSAIMHTKLMTFEQTTDPTGQLRNDVVWFGSANMTAATGAESFNNTVTIYGDPALFAGMNDYWRDLFNQRHAAGDNYYDAQSGRGFVSTASARVYASPEADTDLIKNRMNDIIAEDGCEVRAAQAMIFDSRLDLVDELVRLKRGKCFVRVAANKVQPTALARLKAAGIDVTKGRVHDKFVLVNARFAGSTQKRQIVFTGSHNWTKSANSVNDELFIRLESTELYDAYREHFRQAYVAGDPQ